MSRFTASARRARSAVFEGEGAVEDDDVLSVTRSGLKACIRGSLRSSLAFALLRLPPFGRRGMASSDGIPALFEPIATKGELLGFRLVSVASPGELRG